MGNRNVAEVEGGEVSGDQERRAGLNARCCDVGAGPDRRTPAQYVGEDLALSPAGLEHAGDDVGRACARDRYWRRRLALSHTKAEGIPR